MVVFWVPMVEVWRHLEFWGFLRDVLKSEFGEKCMTTGGEKFEFLGYLPSSCKVVGM